MFRVSINTIFIIFSPIQEETHYYFVHDKIGEGVFRLYESDTERFLLSAKKKKNAFYISQYEVIPDDLIENHRYCAILIEEVKGSWSLYNIGCEFCDDYLNKYSCSSNNSCNDNDYEDPTSRQCLLKLKQFNYKIKECSVDARHVKLEIPLLNEENHRDSWCPRCPKKASMKLKTRLPIWNEKLNSLSMNFPGNSVRMSSNKNCVLENENKEMLMIFGKYGHKKFSLNIYGVLCVIQGFGMCLSMYNWLK